MNKALVLADLDLLGFAIKGESACPNFKLHSNIQVGDVLVIGIMNKNKPTEKVLKDLLFLRSLPKTSIHDHIIKYDEKEGEGSRFGEITIPCVLYYHYEIYDYQGRFHSATVTSKYANNEPTTSVPPGV